MTGAWLLAPDFNTNTAVALGTLVLVTGGAVNQGILFEQTCTDSPITIGTSAIAFSPLAQNTAQAATSATSNSIGTGSKTFTIQSGKAFVSNQYVVIYQTTNTANAMLAQVTSYSGGTPGGERGRHGRLRSRYHQLVDRAHQLPGRRRHPAGGRHWQCDGAGKCDGGACRDLRGQHRQGAPGRRRPGRARRAQRHRRRSFAASASALGATMLNGTIVPRSLGAR